MDQDIGDNVTKMCNFSQNIGLQLLGGDTQPAVLHSQTLGMLKYLLFLEVKGGLHVKGSVEVDEVLRGERGPWR